MNLYLDIDDNTDEYDEDTNPGGTRTVLERPPLGYFTTDADGQRIYTLSRCLSELNMTRIYLRDAIKLGCAVLVG